MDGCGRSDDNTDVCADTDFQNQLMLVSPYFIPEKVKLATKRRWNATNTTSNGAATKNVPAAITPQSEPPSPPDVKEASPTVSPSPQGDEVAISGHRNSFQCVVTETMANAISPGRASGSNTRKISVSTEAPSIIAAS